MYINSTSISIDLYGGNPSILRCPSYSKVLHIHIKAGQLIITYSSESYVNISNDPSWKSFYFKVLKGLYQNNSSVTLEYEYFNTIRIEEDDMAEYYHIFVQEFKTLEEQRDVRLTEVMDQDF